VIEAPSRIDPSGANPEPVGPLPEGARGLLMAVKAYERLAIRAALENSFDLARRALLSNPIVGDWDAAGELLGALIASDKRHLGYLAAHKTA
jgi:6-phospho-beta-glucosidase